MIISVPQIDDRAAGHCDPIGDVGVVRPDHPRTTGDQKFLMTEPFGSILKWTSDGFMSAAHRTSWFG